MEVNVQLENHEQRLKSAEHRIKDLEETYKQINSLTVSIEKMAVSMQAMAEEQKRQSDRLDDIENKPAKRWDMLITTAISCLVSGGLGFLLSSIIK